MQNYDPESQLLTYEGQLLADNTLLIDLQKEINGQHDVAVY